jgi:N-acetylglucosaminyl-diphospho-decaprenol L-rhamnosyltransferase
VGAATADTSVHDLADLQRMASTTRVVIVHYGDPSLTRRAIESVRSGLVAPRDIIVVDNGPGTYPEDDGGDNPQLTVVRPGWNTGFGGGVTLGVAAPTRDPSHYVWLLNNDAMAEPSALAELLAAEKRSGGLALISSQVEDEDTGETWSEHARFLPWRMEARQPAREARTTGEAPVKFAPSWRSVPYLSGCSLLIPSAILMSVGGFDPAFFMYGEDVDFSLRAARNGYLLLLARDSVVIHRTSSGTETVARERMVSESGLRLTYKHFAWLVPAALLGAVATGIKRAAARRRPWPLTIRLRGYLDALRPRGSSPHPPPTRTGT